MDIYSVKLKGYRELCYYAVENLVELAEKLEECDEMVEIITYIGTTE